MSTLNAEKLLNSLAQDFEKFTADNNFDNPLFIGIRTGGVWVAKHLQKILNNKTKLGILDISFYRDDFSRVGLQPTVKPSQLPLSVDDRHIVLVDDVLHTGRTVRAALNEIFDYGRPASVCLVVLVQRSGRELPIQANIVGETITLNATQHVKLSRTEDKLKSLILEVVD